MCVCGGGGGGVGNDNVNYFYWTSAITMPELEEINLVLDHGDSLTDIKMKFVITLLRFFSLRNEIVEVI